MVQYFVKEPELGHELAQLLAPSAVLRSPRSEAEGGAEGGGGGERLGMVREEPGDGEETKETKEETKYSGGGTGSGSSSSSSSSSSSVGQGSGGRGEEEWPRQVPQCVQIAALHALDALASDRKVREENRREETRNMRCER